MATVAARAPKRDLAPDWRDALRASMRRFAVRTWGALLIGVSLAGGGRARHPQPERPVAEHRGRRSAEQLARQRRRLCQRRAAVAVRARLDPVPAGDRHRRPSDDAAAARRADRPRPAARRDRRGADRNRARPDQRLGGFRACPAAGAARSGSAARTASTAAIGLIPQSADRRARTLRRSAAVRAQRARRSAISRLG